MRMHRSWLFAAAFLGGAALAISPAAAQKKYDPGANDTEIKIGNTNPYSGPASAYGVIGKTIAAYFNKINAEGGVNVSLYKSLTFGVSALYTGIAGALGAIAVQFVAPDSFSCSSPLVPPSGTTPRIIPGPSAGSRTIRAKATSTRST